MIKSNLEFKPVLVTMERKGTVQYYLKFHIGEDLEGDLTMCDVIEVLNHDLIVPIETQQIIKSDKINMRFLKLDEKDDKNE